jgi:hypothetical protein
MENLFPTLFLFLFFFPHPPTCVQFVIFSSMALDVFSLLQVNASALCGLAFERLLLQHAARFELKC